MDGESGLGGFYGFLFGRHGNSRKQERSVSANGQIHEIHETNGRPDSGDETMRAGGGLTVEIDLQNVEDKVSAGLLGQLPWPQNTRFRPCVRAGQHRMLGLRVLGPKPCTVCNRGIRSTRIGASMKTSEDCFQAFLKIKSEAVQFELQFQTEADTRARLISRILHEVLVGCL